MMVQRLIFKLNKFLEILLMLIRFNKICTGSVFLGHSVSSKFSLLTNIHIYIVNLEPELESNNGAAVVVTVLEIIDFRGGTGA